MNSLLFLTNELMNPTLRKEMHLPLNFIQFAIMKGKMYRHYRNPSSFVTTEELNKRWGNSVVYGGIFLCQDFDFYSRILDAYHICSKSTLLKNHHQDMHHRVETTITPIHFKTLDELAALKYREGEDITAQTYLGNMKNPKISQRVFTQASYRIVDGIDVFNFKKLFWEEFNEQHYEQ